MNIFLCGFMGSGKSTIGKSLASDLEIDFIDLDDDIQNKNKMSINTIFKKFSETYFRELETKSLKDICKNDNQIVSLGGGTLLREENTKIIKSSGVLIYLDVNEDTVYSRLKNDTSRPLLNVDDKFSVITKKMSERTPIYQNNADFIVNGNHNPEKVVNFIKKIINIKKN